VVDCRAAAAAATAVAAAAAAARASVELANAREVEALGARMTVAERTAARDRLLTASAAATSATAEARRLAMASEAAEGRAAGLAPVLPRLAECARCGPASPLNPRRGWALAAIAALLTDPPLRQAEFPRFVPLLAATLHAYAGDGQRKSAGEGVAQGSVGRGVGQVVLPPGSRVPSAASFARAAAEAAEAEAAAMSRAGAEELVERERLANVSCSALLHLCFHSGPALKLLRGLPEGPRKPEGPGTEGPEATAGRQHPEAAGAAGASAHTGACAAEGPLLVLATDRSVCRRARRHAAQLLLLVGFRARKAGR